VNNDFGIGVGGENVTGALQFGAQGFVVVDFAVEDHRYVPVFAENRLDACRQVDDRQPSRAESQRAAVVIGAVAIRPAMRQPPRHAVDQRPVSAERIVLSVDAAHSSPQTLC
jgi:hypothetical protein